jgi:hypothetical protein
MTGTALRLSVNGVALTTATDAAITAAGSTTGTLSGFGTNETVSYRLDAATPLTGFPTVVDTTGSAPISSLPIPATTQGPHTVYAIGGNGSVASTTITYDTVAPAVTPSLSPTANGAGWNNTSPVTVTLAATDATSGVAAVKYTIDGTDPTVSGTALTYSAPFTLASTATVRFYATDAAANASAVGSQAVKVDTVAPTNALALSSVTGAQLTGSTLYYRGVAVGSFTLTNTVADAGSGPASSTTATLGGTTTGFTHTASTVSTPAGGPYVSNVFSWSAATSSAPTETVTGADAAGNTTATALGFVNDSTAPAGGSVDATGLAGSGSRYSTSTAVSVAFAKGTDTGSGLATSGTLLQRATATLTGGVCGSYGTATTIATDPTTPYADTVSDQACYRYQYVVADQLGNSVTYTGGDVKVDTSAPSAISFASSAMTNAYLTGTTLFYRSSAASGSITLTGAATDAASAILGYTYPGFGANWTSTPGATGVNTYSWSGAPGAPGTPAVVATDNALLTTNTTLTVLSDTTAPTGSAPTYTAGFLSSASASITIPAGSDGAGSGVSTTAGLLQRQSATMTAGVCGTYGSFSTIATGPPSPYSDTSVVNGNCYRYQYVYADNVGNQQTPYASSTVVKAPKFYTCAAAATTDGADEYYRLAETTGTVAADSSGRTPPRTGAYTGTVALGTVGACGSGITLTSAAAGYVAPGVSFNNPTVYSEEVWFKTSTTGATTGRLIGLSSAQTGGSGSYDRHVWMSSDGKVNFGAYNILLVIPLNITITSTQTFNDAKWHHVAATQSASGMKLYVDSVLVAGNGVAGAQNFTGYWRVGWDNLLAWGSQGNTDYFNGSVSNAAFYNGAELSATQIYDHYIAGAVSSGALLTAPSISASAQATALTIRRTAAAVIASSTPPRPSSPRSSPAPSTIATPSPIPPPSVSAPPAPSPPASSPAPTVTLPEEHPSPSG